jgi:hypothetical protein
MQPGSGAPLALHVCRRCGSGLTPVAYGFPTLDTFEAAERGEVLLGGCVLSDDLPELDCRSCRQGGAEIG